MKHLFYCFVRC